MWNVLSKEMRMPALAAAACAAVILVASPVSAAPDVVTSNVFLKRLSQDCSLMKGKLRGHCMQRFHGYLAEATDERLSCTDDRATCDAAVLKYWKDKYDLLWPNG